MYHDVTQVLLTACVAGAPPDLDPHLTFAGSRKSFLHSIHGELAKVSATYRTLALLPFVNLSACAFSKTFLAMHL
eukprot:s443_g35.t1